MCTPRGRTGSSRCPGWVGALAASRAAGLEILAQYVGEYDAIGMSCRVAARAGGLLFEPAYKPELLAQLGEAGNDAPASLPLLPVGLLPGIRDPYVVTGGPMKGMKGAFVRGADGTVESLDAGGRLLAKVSLG